MTTRSLETCYIPVLPLQRYLIPPYTNHKATLCLSDSISLIYGSSNDT